MYNLNGTKTKKKDEEKNRKKLHSLGCNYYRYSFICMSIHILLFIHQVKRFCIYIYMFCHFQMRQWSRRQIKHQNTDMDEVQAVSEICVFPLNFYLIFLPDLPATVLPSEYYYVTMSALASALHIHRVISKFKYNL